MLKNWENVVMVPVGDSLAMADAIVKLLTEPELCGKISGNAKRLSESFSWPSIAEDHINLYNTTLNKIRSDVQA